MAGVETEQYSFLVDLMALAEMPGLVASILGEDLGGGESPAGIFPGPLPIQYTVHLDGDDIVRRVVIGVDLGAILGEVFAEFDQLVEDPEGEGSGMPEIEFRISSRLETLSVNDPALSVTLPDPSQVVELAPLRQRVDGPSSHRFHTRATARPPEVGRPSEIAGWVASAKRGDE